MRSSFDFQRNLATLPRKAQLNVQKTLGRILNGQ